MKDIKIKLKNAGKFIVLKMIRCNPFNKNAYGFDPVPVGRYGKRKKQ